MKASPLTRSILDLVCRALDLELSDRKLEPDRGPHRWTRAEVLAAMWADPIGIAVVRDLVAWAAARRLRVTGTATRSPALAWHLDALETDYTFFVADSRHARSQGSVIWLYMQFLKSKPVLSDPIRRDALIKALSARFTIQGGREDKLPTIPLSALADPDAFEIFTAAWDTVIDDIRRAGAKRRWPASSRRPTFRRPRQS